MSDENDSTDDAGDEPARPRNLLQEGIDILNRGLAQAAVTPLIPPDNLEIRAVPANERQRRFSGLFGPKPGAYERGRPLGATPEEALHLLPRIHILDEQEYAERSERVDEIRRRMPTGFDHDMHLLIYNVGLSAYGADKNAEFARQRSVELDERVLIELRQTVDPAWQFAELAALAQEIVGWAAGVAEEAAHTANQHAHDARVVPATITEAIDDALRASTIFYHHGRSGATDDLMLRLEASGDAVAVAQGKVETHDREAHDSLQITNAALQVCDVVLNAVHVVGQIIAIRNEVTAFEFDGFLDGVGPDRILRITHDRVQRELPIVRQALLDAVAELRNHANLHAELGMEGRLLMIARAWRGYIEETTEFFNVVRPWRDEVGRIQQLPLEQRHAGRQVDPGVIEPTPEQIQDVREQYHEFNVLIQQAFEAVGNPLHHLGALNMARATYRFVGPDTVPVTVRQGDELVIELHRVRRALVQAVAVFGGREVLTEEVNALIDRVIDGITNEARRIEEHLAQIIPRPATLFAPGMPRRRWMNLAEFHEPIVRRLFDEPAAAAPDPALPILNPDDDPIERNTIDPSMNIVLVSSASEVALTSELLPGITIWHYEDTELQRPIDYIYFVCAPRATDEERDIVHVLRNTFAAVMEEMDSRDISARREEQALAYPTHPRFGVFRMRRTRTRLCTAVDVSGLAEFIPSMEVRLQRPDDGRTAGILAIVRLLVQDQRFLNQDQLEPTPAMMALEALATQISTHLNVVIQDVSAFLNRAGFGNQLRGMKLLMNLRLVNIEFENPAILVIAIVFGMTASPQELRLIRFISAQARKHLERVPATSTPFLIDDIYGQLPTVPETRFFNVPAARPQIFGVTNSANLGNTVDVRVNLRVGISPGDNIALAIFVGVDANPNERVIAHHVARVLNRLGITTEVIDLVVTPLF